MPSYTDIEADLKIANAEVEQLRAEIDKLNAELHRCTSGNGTYISIEASNRDISKLREAISRYCHNDCYRDSCEGNGGVGIPDCPLARYAPLPSAPKKG